MADGGCCSRHKHARLAPPTNTPCTTLHDSNGVFTRKKAGQPPTLVALQAAAQQSSALRCSPPILSGLRIRGEVVVVTRHAFAALFRADQSQTKHSTSACS